MLETVELSALQNGSDIRGIAMEGIPDEEVNLTAEVAYRIGKAFAVYLGSLLQKQCRDLTISVGTDSRISGPEMKRYFMLGVRSTDARIVDCGLASTPAMYMSLIYEETAYDGACMITASHLPFNRNGMKFFGKDGGFEKKDIREILSLAGKAYPEELPQEEVAEKTDCDLISVYAEHLVSYIREEVGDGEQPLNGLKIVVDAGNGAGGFFAQKVLLPLGADISGSQFLNPDGSFPNHIPNPEDKIAMASISEATVSNKADLGLIFDTDVDRMSAVLSDGTALNRDAIIAMMAAILAPEYPGSTIITDSVTSDRLTEFLEQTLGLKHLCYKRGYKNVIEKCKELNQKGEVSPLAMETSGHGCLKDNYYLDDGAFLAVKLVIAVAKAAKAGRKVDSFIEKLKVEFADKEVRFRIQTDNFSSYGEQVLKEVENRCKEKGYDLPISYEGIRIRFPNGWMLLRASLHDPVMVLNLEGKTESDLEELIRIAKDLIRGFSNLDVSTLK